MWFKTNRKCNEKNKQKQEPNKRNAKGLEFISFQFVVCVFNVVAFAPYDFEHIGCFASQ